MFPTEPAMPDDTAPLGPGWFLGICGVLTVAMLAAVCFLPHDRYLRFSALHDAAVVKAGWIYQRIHVDKNPIDVVFIGTSHTLMAVDSALVEGGYRKSAGRPLHVVNFALEHFGRDNQYLLAREAIENRTIALLVLEVTEEEERALHPAFGALADPGDILTAPLLINPSWFPNLSGLPIRQVSLFRSSAARIASGKSDEPGLKFYRGAHWDDTYIEAGSPADPIRNAKPRLDAPGAAELERQRLRYQALSRNKRALPGPLHALEGRANRVYLREIVALARAHGVALRFLFLPSYAATAGPSVNEPEFAAIPVWHPAEAMARTDRWYDVNHVNYRGAEAVSAWLATKLQEEKAAGILKR